MTVAQYIDTQYKIAESPDIKFKAAANGIPLKKQVLQLRINQVYDLARIMNKYGADLVVEIIQTEKTEGLV
jgi:hypothetical protein